MGGDGSAVLPLTRTIPTLVVRWLLDRYDVNISENRRRAKILLSQLESDEFRPVYRWVYEEFLRLFPVSFTSEMVDLVSPPDLRFMNLTRCLNVCNHEAALKVWRKTLARCQCVESLILNELSVHTGYEPVIEAIFKHMNVPLITHLSLEGATHIYNKDVKALLIGLPNVMILNLSLCHGVNDQVFFFDEDQRAGPNRHYLPGKPRPCRKLCDVDLNGCEVLTNAAIRYLVQLCGDNLKSLNIAGTSMTCDVLWYLSGYSYSSLLEALQEQCFQLPADVESDDTKSDEIEKELSRLLKVYCEERKKVTDIPPSGKAVQTVQNKSTTYRKAFASVFQRLYGMWDSQGESEDQGSSSSSHSSSACSNSNQPEDDSEPSDNVEVYPNGGGACGKEGRHLQGNSSSSGASTSPVGGRGNESGGPCLPRLKPLFQPNMLNLDFGKLEFSEAVLPFCLEEFFAANRQMQKIVMGHVDITDCMLRILATHSEEVRFLHLFDSQKVTSEGVACLLKNSPKVAHLDLTGCVQVDDRGIRPVFGWERSSNLSVLKLSQTQITDATLKDIAKFIGHQLEALELRSCERLTDAGVHHVVERCTCLTTLHIKDLPLRERTVLAVTENLTGLVHLGLSRVACFGDDMARSVADRLKWLQTLDISWNETVTDEGLEYILAGCPKLSKLDIMGTCITERPFLPTIRRYDKWKRCHALILIKKRERKLNAMRGYELLSSDEEYDEMHLPVRSTSYAPTLTYVDMTHSQPADIQLLKQVVAISKGTIGFTDYRGEYVPPRLF